VILAASVFEISAGKKQTDRQTNSGEKPTYTTAVGEDYNFNPKLPKCNKLFSGP